MRQRHHPPCVEAQSFLSPGETKTSSSRMSYFKIVRNLHFRVLLRRGRLLLLQGPLFLLVVLLLPWGRFFVQSSDRSYAHHLADLEELRKQFPTLPSNVTISVVLMNHNRPRMVRESLLTTTLSMHSAVNEILLCHSNLGTKFVWNSVTSTLRAPSKRREAVKEEMTWAMSRFKLV